MVTKEQAKGIAGKTSFWVFSAPASIIFTLIGLYNLFFSEDYLTGVFFIILGIGYFSWRYTSMKKWIKSS
ncbi:hypothetical protein ISS07_03380 [Candidatus Woesearchaeota archaeon]|nr:hypothetical protein [Candidatus Woesearchaeota archaeon]